MRKIIGKKNKVHYVEETTRYKMVKSHKGWLVIGTSMFALGLGVLVTSQPVSADVVATSTSSSAVNAETPGASSSSTTNAETPGASSSSTTNAETPGASSSSATNAEMTGASSSSTTNAETPGASSSSTTNAETPGASSSSTTEALATDKAVLTHVTKDNFLAYFSLNGSATYDQNTGIVTITPDENDKVGNFSLKSKIDMNSSFTLTGQVNIGNKTSSQGGADGIGFAFHNGNTTDVGNAGGNLGIAGLQDAIGFKLDTWHNDNFTPQATVPGAQVSSTDSNGFGWSQDPSNPQFGAFVTTDSEEIKATDEKPYQRWWATTDMSSVKGLSSNNLDGNFHNFVVSYDGHSRLLTINYTEASGNVLTWTKEVDSSYQAMAMIISASTGGAKNLQQFKITSFDFKQAATVNVKYVDTKGNQIAQGKVTYPNGANVNGTYTTGQLEIPNYKFVRMDDGTATGAKSLPATGTLTKAEDNGTVIYVYAPAYTQTSKTISETIKYIDQDGKEVAKGYTADPITFVTVTNPVDNTTTTYYSTKAKTATLDDNGVPTEAGWTKADSTDFAEVVNPEVDGYKVISNDAPNSDLTNVAVQTVYTNSSDLNFTVVYAKNAPTITTESKTINETIHYVYKDGTTAHDDYVAKPVEFTREVSTDAVTGEKTYGSWSADQSFAAVTSPVIKGYTPDQAEIGAQTVSGDASDLDFTVIYTKDAPTITTESKTINETIHYVYKDGSKAADDYVAKPVEFTRQVSTDAVTGEKTYGNWSADQSFDAVTSPELKGYTADKAQIDKQTVNGDSKDLEFTVTYTKNAPTITTEKKTVNETIHYVYKDGSKAADDYVAKPVEFTRQVSTDAVTGEKTYGNWSADQSFDAVTSPELKGYTADKAQIDKQTVSGDSKDLEFTVTYTKNAPTMTVNPSQPTTPAKPVNPSQPTTPTKPVQAGQAAATNFVDQRLPQTGETDQQHMTLSGLLLLAMSSLLGLFGMTKRQRKE